MTCLYQVIIYRVAGKSCRPYIIYIFLFQMDDTNSCRLEERVRVTRLSGYADFWSFSWYFSRKSFHTDEPIDENMTSEMEIKFGYLRATLCSPRKIIIRS